MGGTFANIGGVARSRLASISDAGAVDPAWDVIANSTVTSLAVMQNELYAGGAFSTLNGQTHVRLAAISLSGTATPGVVRTSFNVNAAVNTISAGRDFIVFGGTFNTVRGVSRVRFAAVSANALLPVTISAASTVSSVSVAGNNAHIAGSFTTFGGAAASRATIGNVFFGASHSIPNEGLSAAAQNSLVAGNLHFVGGTFANASAQNVFRTGLFVFAAD